MKFRYIIAALFLSLAVGCVQEELSTLSEIQVSESYLAIDVNGGSASTTVNATEGWQVDPSSVPAWLTVSPMSGNAGSSQITFSAVEKPVSPGLVQVSASLIFNDLFSYPGNNNQNNKLLGDKLLLDIAQYYIQNGNVWFPYDLTPAYERVEEEVPAETPEA